MPAATTIYTPDWPVRYMVENSLGRLWIEGHPNDELKTKWKYYLEDVEQETEVRSTLVNIRKEYANISPEQIKCIDPCSGSGHICAYIFDVLIQIYETYGYSAHEAVRSIIKNNLYGLDIDERAAQLAYFTVMMKARQYDRRFLTRTDEAGNVDVPQPHLYAICESNGVDNYALDYFVNSDDSLKSAMNSIIREMQDAKEYGSIIKLSPVDFQSLYARFDEVYNDINISRETVLTEILQLVKVAEVLSQTYHVIVTNPPYLGSSRFSTKLEKYIKKNYVDEKSDLSMVMLKRALTRYVKRDGFVAFITTNSWMVLSRFEKLRNFILDGYSFESMVDFGTELFEGKVGHNPIVAWVNRASKMDKQFVAIRLVDYCYGRRDEKEKEFFNTTNYYYPKQSSFYAIPSAALTYSFSDKMISAFSKLPAVSDKATTRLGMTTADNNRFVRLWFEVESDKCLFNARNEDDVLAAGKKWVPYNKGGKYRKWYGNHDCVVNWENSGHEIKNFADEKGHIRSTVPNTDYYFQPCATWSKISSGAIAFRYRDYGSIFDVAGACLFTNRGLYQLMGFLNSNVADSILSVLSPTLNYEGSHIAALPVNEHMLTNSALEEIVKENIRISREDWDSFEFSWDFKKHPLVRGSSLREAYIDWEKECQCRFDKLKYNEEKINTMLIEEYGLQREVSPRVEDRMVTVSKANKSADIRSLISYAVGCMFGRYSLDMDGVAYAGGVWDDSKYITFPADRDNIIPICDDEYFSDDIVGRFVKFVEVVYGTETLSDNLKFIAEALGGKGQPKDIIRDYFINNFYSDHCSACAFGTSGKRPIYWLFDSGKKNSFKALIYMHRYQPDTIARMRTDYVHEQQARYRTAIADLEQRITTASTSDRVKLNKKLKTLQEQATEIQGYEEKIHHLADQYINIDLDDGVKKNYEIFRDVLAKIK